jgi:hypothetical protein
MKAYTVAFGGPSDPTTPEGKDADAGMRRGLGLETASDPDLGAPASNDPMKAARQVIRSQAAWDYAERELVHVEARPGTPLQAVSLSRQSDGFSAFSDHGF